ncbi:MULTISPECIES: hypothetical protein [Pseudoalteromonas]|uniref:hypothetical protein n=1 Tax=Pseudoalteromonas TaxID=53246 RepID=UPI00029B567C|nr:MULTISPECIES: hypothetical protein [Pseudoalteromonas]MBR8845625.1 hypothetical protein [Pseudoalteromonas sp. JC3]NSY34805.1 hypothetical protein [Pseudoalteromonas sp. JC28]QUI72620.1 hypothetical protein GSF13_24200 [Pseudoalteromonas sp. M8]UDM60032.1 hypothetical protein KIJ96_09140 [Pseudoalteromonas piscicida]WJE08834.1 hypothetical protein QSH61_18570 [Pseudoalteromonas sp. JC3]
MNSQFLDICRIEQVENGVAQGRLVLSNYCGTLAVDPLFLALEGIHQAAVRVGKKVIEGASSREIRVLPVNINQFQQLGEFVLQDYQFSCEAAPFGPSARVKISVYEAPDKPVVAESQITVAKI